MTYSESTSNSTSDPSEIEQKKLKKFQFYSLKVLRNFKNHTFLLTGGVFLAAAKPSFNTSNTTLLRTKSTRKRLFSVGPMRRKTGAKLAYSVLYFPLYRRAIALPPPTACSKRKSERIFGIYVKFYIRSI